MSQQNSMKEEDKLIRNKFRPYY